MQTVISFFFFYMKIDVNEKENKTRLKNCRLSLNACVAM
jgi:hypothetical protein